MHLYETQQDLRTLKNKIIRTIKNIAISRQENKQTIKYPTYKCSYYNNFQMICIAFDGRNN